MLIHLRQTIERIATPRSVLLIFLSLLPFIFVFFRWRSRQLEAILGYPPRLFDTRVPYSPQEVHQLAGDLGESGRRLYAATEVTLDFAFPPLYTTWLSLTLAVVWRKAQTARTAQGGWAWLPLLPYLGMVGDLTENVSLASLMMLFPGEPAWLAQFSNLASLVKWGAGLGSLVMIVVGLGIKIVQAFNRHTSQVS